MKKNILVLFILSICMNLNAVDFVKVKGGTFNRETCFYWEKEKICKQKIKISSFEIATTELTVKEYKEFLDATKREIPEEMAKLEKEQDISNYPAFEVSFYDAIEYCNWRSEKEGLEKCYTITERKDEPNNIDWNRIPKSASWKHFPEVIWNQKANGYRLPTEAEWEYAATACGKDKAIMSGEKEVIEKYAYVSENGGKKPPYREVKKYLPNKIGLYDLYDNVFDWCFDYFNVDYYIHGVKLVNPIGPVIGNDPGDDFSYFPMYNRVKKGIGGLSKKSSFKVYMLVIGGNPLETSSNGIRLARNVK